jgi:hypothetical protein
MSAGTPTPRSKRGARIALIRARARINPLALLALPVVALAYAYFAQASPLLGQSFGAVAILTALATLCVAGVLVRPTTDRLELFRVVSFYYLMAFCFAPLFEPAESLYVHEEPRAVLVQRSAALALFAYVCIAIGYHLPFYRRTPAVVMTRHDEYDAPFATVVGLALFVIGTVSFVALFVLAGGAAVILRGEGGLARTEFSFGLGWYYWGSLLMLPGGAIYFAAQASRRRALGWIHAWPLVSAFTLLLLLQGRHRALGPLLVSLAISHYLLGRIRLPRLAVFALGAIALSILMSSARSPSVRGVFAADPIRFSAAVLRDFPERAETILSGDIGRIDEVMIVIDHVPDRMPYDLGWSLTIPFNPFRRLIWGVGSEAPAVGGRLYLIARPDMRGSLYRTGFLPSIVGEMRANFPAVLCVFPFLLYGMGLRAVYQRLVVKRADFLSIAGYAILGLFLCNMVIQTFAQNLFELFVVSAPVFVVRRLVRRGRRTVASAEALGEALPTPRG